MVLGKTLNLCVVYFKTWTACTYHFFVVSSVQFSDCYHCTNIYYRFTLTYLEISIIFYRLLLNYSYRHISVPGWRWYNQFKSDIRFPLPYITSSYDYSLDLLLRFPLLLSLLGFVVFRMRSLSYDYHTRNSC